MEAKGAVCCSPAILLAGLLAHRGGVQQGRGDSAADRGTHEGDARRGDWMGSGRDRARRCEGLVRPRRLRRSRSIVVRIAVKQFSRWAMVMRSYRDERLLARPEAEAARRRGPRHPQKGGGEDLRRLDAVSRRCAMGWFGHCGYDVAQHSL